MVIKQIMVVAAHLLSTFMHTKSKQSPRHQFHIMCVWFYNWHVCIRLEKTIVCKDESGCSSYYLSCLLLASSSFPIIHCCFCKRSDKSTTLFSYRVDTVNLINQCSINTSFHVSVFNGSQCRQPSCLSVKLGFV